MSHWTTNLERLLAPPVRRPLPPVIWPGVRLVTFTRDGTPRIMGFAEALAYSRGRLIRASQGTIEVDL